MKSDIIGLTETQISLSDSTCRIDETLNFFNINFNNSEDKFLSLAYGCRNNVAVLDKFDTNAVFIYGVLVSRIMILLIEYSL